MYNFFFNKMHLVGFEPKHPTKIIAEICMINASKNL